MTEVFEKVKKIWGQLPLLVKILLPSVSIGLILLSSLYFTKSPEFQPLYNNLSTEDVIEIEKILSEKGVEYIVQEADSSISVKGNVSSIKRELATLGYPRNSELTGLSRFNELSIGATKFDKEVQYQSRLQEELELSIKEAFDIIQSVKVTLPRLEQQSFYKSERTEPKISIAIKTRNNEEVLPNSVKSIQLFVASSIQDVKVENVEVVDSNMNVLSNTEEENIRSLSNQYKIIEETKKIIERDLQDVLSEVYGRVRVIASIDINFDEIVQNIETYDPEGTLLSREGDQERERRTEGNPGNVAGVDNNQDVPGYEIENLDEEDVTYLRDKEKMIENFEVGKTVEKIIHHPELRNTNVAVWVDEELAQDEIINLEEMIAISSGLTGEAEMVQNDKSVYDNGSVKVTQRRFAEIAEVDFDEEIVDEEETSVPMWVWLSLGISGLVILLLIFFLFSTKKRIKKEIDLPLVNEEEQADEPQENEKQIEMVNVEKEITNNQNIEETEDKFEFEWTKKQKSLRELTNDVSQKYTKEAADVIRRMMNNDKP